MAQTFQLQLKENELVEDTALKQQLLVCKKGMVEQYQRLLEQDWVIRATKEANLRLEHTLGVKQQAWKRKRELLY